jgi:hypothetical protein
MAMTCTGVLLVRVKGDSERAVSAGHTVERCARSNGMDIELLSSMCFAATSIS